MIEQTSFWIAFAVIVMALLAFDLGFVNRKAHASGMKEAVLLSIFYIVVSLLFAGFVYIELGADKSFEFLTAYILEKSLSVDNLFVFLIIFGYFNVGLKYQHRILFWGIIGALLTRGIFIFVGITAINYFHVLIYAFGAFLVYTSIKLARGAENEVNPGENKLLKLGSKYLPLKDKYEGSSFFIKDAGKYFFTPLFLVLLVIESTDVMFATDSVPAVISVTNDAFIAYTSNIFAILGLRALYFVIARVMQEFPYLKYGITMVLGFIGVKMLISDFYKVPTGISLLIVAACLIGSGLISWFINKNKEDEPEDIKAVATK